MYRFKLNNAELNIEHFPEHVKEFIKDTLLSGLETDGHELYTIQVEEVEFKHRDGFIPSSYNRGGFDAIGFTDLISLWSSGTEVSHKKAQAEIERQIEASFDYLRDDLSEKYSELMTKFNLTKEDLTYRNLDKLSEKHPELTDLFKAFEEGEDSYLSDDSSSIMFSARFLYHGYDNGTHSASISAAVNTEGPYHRSHISWSPSTFCEGAKEIEITWANEKEFKRKFIKALNQCIKEVF